MGEGSNLLVSDDGLDAAVVRLRSAFFRRIAVQNNLVFAAAGVPLAALCIYAEKNGLSGCEFLSGIPGTVGGALVMNAGSREVDADQGAGRVCSMSQIVSQLEVMNRHGEVSLYAKEDVEFGYRSSNLKGMIVLGAWFRLAPADRDAIKQRGERFIGRKRTTQDLTLPSAGCVFKNPAESRHGAGALIDQCRLKGTVVGDAQVSTIHANFIVNKGNARFAEVKALMELVQTKVWEHCSVRLEPEVEIWGQGGLR
jgi:UDP-N-acetylenolpyruvoylglucosamine reductase